MNLRNNYALLLYSFLGLSLQAGPITLGTASNYSVLAGSAVTNTGATVLAEDLGLSPGTSVTGFPPGVVNGTENVTDANALTAQNDALTAYNSLAGAAPNQNLTGHDLGGLTLLPGVYKFDSSAQLTGALTLNLLGNANSLFIFQIGSTLTTASNSSVTTINGADCCNVFWQIGSSATLGTGTDFRGNILAQTSITLNTGANISDGRALALTGAVTLDDNNISSVVCDTISSAATPEPGSLMMLGAGLLCLVLHGGRASRKQSP